MELKELTYNKQFARELLAARFIDLQLTKEERYKHSLCSYNFNKILIPINTELTIFQLPVNEIYAYQLADEESRFTFYLLMEIDKKGLDKIVEELGSPHHITYDDYRADDYDFLSWDYNKEIAITIMQSYMSGSRRNPGYINIHLIISNMHHEDIANREPLIE